MDNADRIQTFQFKSLQTECLEICYLFVEEICVRSQMIDSSASGDFIRKNISYLKKRKEILNIINSLVPKYSQTILVPKKFFGFQVQYCLDLRKPDLRKNLDLRKIVATTDFLVHKLFDLRKIF